MNDMELFAEFLKYVLQSIEKVESGQDSQALAVELKRKYERIKARGKEEAFHAFIKKEYGKEKEIYKFLLQYLCDMTRISGFLVKYLEMELEKQLAKDKDLFMELNLREQIASLLFQEGKQIPFQKEWRLNQAIAEIGPGYLNTVYDEIKKEERDPDFVVIFVKQFLNDSHAPTKLLLEISRIIQKKLGKKVWIISAILKTDIAMLEQLEIAGDFLVTNYAKQRGSVCVTYKEETMPVYQLIVEKGNEEEIKAVWDKIYEVKPFCVWNLAAEPLWTDIAKQFTSSLYTIMRQGYPAVCADMIVHYIPSVHPEDRENREFLLRNHVDLIETEFLFPYEKPCGSLNRRDAGIPEESFCLGIAGTRLLTECSDSFLETLFCAAKEDSGLFVWFVGLYEGDKEKLEKKLEGKLRRYRLTGYENDLIEYLNLFDLFVNPPRIGGGNTGAMALSAGVPVLTLDKGDIASVAGKEFTVESLKDYPEMIQRYKRDSAFYQRQSRLAKKRIEEKTTDDEEFAAIIQSVFDRIG